MNRETIRVLLIEDDADDAALIGHYLSENHAGEAEPAFELKVSDRLSSGCQQLEREPFDAVLLDLMLPGGIGVEALERLLELRPKQPVIVLTGLRDSALASRAMRLGAQDYLIKGTIDGRLLKRSLLYAIERGRLVGRLESVLNGDLDGKLVVDEGGRVLYANPAAEALMGRKPGEAVGRPLPVTAVSEGALDEKLGTRLVETRSAPMDWEGRPVKLVTLRDVTELRRLEQMRDEVKERALAVDLKNEFITTVSHELRNPMTTVKTAIQSLRDGLVGPLSPQQKRFVELAHRNVDRQIRIINNVLDLARFQSGHARMEPRMLDLKAAVEDALEGYGLVPGQGPRVETHGPEVLPLVNADADLVTQVVTNLVDNALRYARERVQVRLSASADGSVQLTVSDDGPGMAESQTARLFSRFVQVSRQEAAPGGYKGTGLGLAICKEIVQGHGGRIWVESAPGKGSRFHTIWPGAGARLVTANA
jgi:signal transduction histidine kinase